MPGRVQQYLSEMKCLSFFDESSVCLVRSTQIWCSGSPAPQAEDVAIIVIKGPYGESSNSACCIVVAPWVIVDEQFVGFLEVFSATC